MRDFLDPPSPGLAEDDVDIHDRGGYLEFERCIETGQLSMYAGVLQRSERSFFVVAKVTFVLDGVDEVLEQVLTDSTVAETWPTLVQMLHNGIADRYSDGALIKLEDPDTADTDWFVATVVGIAEVDDAGLKRMAEAAAKVMALTGHLLVEISENEPSALKGLAKAALAGVGMGLLAAFGVNPF